MFRKVESLVQTIRANDFTYVSNFYCGKDSRFKCENLTRYLLDMLERHPTVLILDEAPSYRGCYRTGVPFTSEYIVSKGVWDLFGEDEGYKTKGCTVEMSTLAFWNQAWKLNTFPLCWYIFPIQPYLPGNRKVNRHPTEEELQWGRNILEQIIDLFNIETIVSIGRYTDRVLRKWELVHETLIHPTSDNDKKFIEGFYRKLPVLVQADQSKVLLGLWKMECEACDKILPRNMMEIINNHYFCPECTENYHNEFGPMQKYF